MDICGMRKKNEDFNYCDSDHFIHESCIKNIIKKVKKDRNYYEIDFDCNICGIKHKIKFKYKNIGCTCIIF